MSVFYGKSNLNFTQAGIKWNIKAIDDPANLPAVGKPGEVYILTDKNVNKIKKVATIFEGDDLVDNAINLFYQESTDSKRINYYWGWYFDFKFNSQSIMLNGKGLFTYVYFWDMNVNAWVAIQVSYNFNEKMTALNFIGKDIDIDTLYPTTDFDGEMGDIIILEPIIAPPISEEMNTLIFVGTDINIENIYPTTTFSETIISKLMNGTMIIKPITIQTVSDTLIVSLDNNEYIIGDNTTTPGNALSSEDIKDIVLPNYYKTNEDNLVVTISQYSFNGSDIDTITIPHTYTTIGDYAFANSSLKRILVNKDLINFVGYDQDIQEYKDFTNINKDGIINLTKQITSIGDYAFDNTNLETLRYYGTKSEFESITFGTNWSGNIGLIICNDEQIVLSSTGLFQDNFYMSLNTLETNEDLIIESGKLTYFNPDLIGTLKLTNNIDTIGANSFKSSKLYELYIPNTIDTIEENAFVNTFIDVIHYDGAVSDWGLIQKDTNWENYGVGKVSCSDGDIYYSEFIYGTDISGAQYNFALNKNTKYYVSQNKNVNSSYAIIRFNFTIDNADEYVVMKYINDAWQSSGDYGIYGNVDTALALSTSTSGNILGMNCEEKEIYFRNLANGNHFIDVKYRKDSTGYGGSDTLRIKMIKKY